MKQGTELEALNSGSQSARERKKSQGSAHHEGHCKSKERREPIVPGRLGTAEFDGAPAAMRTANRRGPPISMRGMVGNPNNG